MLRQIRLVPLLLLAVFVLQSCQTGPAKDTLDVSSSVPALTTLDGDSDNILTPAEEEIIRAFELEAAEDWASAADLYQNLADNSVQPERSAFLIRTALMHYQDGLFTFIDPFFDTLDETDILQQDQKYKETIQAGGYLGAGKIYQGLLALPNIEELIDYRFKALALNIRSRGVLAIGDPLESAQLRIEIDKYLKTPQELEKNHDFIWDALNRISESSMIRALKQPQKKSLRGWLELNLIARRSNMLPAKMEPWIDKWYQLYGEHAAAPSYAVGLLEESKRIYIKPTRIALMLPFSGRLEKVSAAIQNGFLYAYYQDPDNVADLELINASNDPAKFNLQYEQAIQNGADFVVGPVDKDLISMLQKRERLSVPTLTLNYGEDDEKAKLNLYQFGLRPEDEAEQIADYALAQGRHQALVLVPDTEWGTRLKQAFTTRFESLGGLVVDSAFYPARKNDYSPAIKDLLNLTTSNQRKSIFQQVIGEEVQFEARRRQDIDMIFIAANSRQARLIKPQLKFHRAQDVPVYATSHISSSLANADDDRDLNEILYVDIPWMLDNEKSRDHQSISKLWPEASTRFSRLFALGIDAYRMIPSLRRLMINPDESLQHNTGKLSVDANGRVRRALLLATYEKGRVKLIAQPNDQQANDQTNN